MKWESEAQQEQSEGPADEREWSYSASEASSSESSDAATDGTWLKVVRWFKRIFGA